MNKLTATLLCGVALGALTIAPAMAGKKHPGFNLTAMYAGRLVNKTPHHYHHCLNNTSSCYMTVYTSVAASNLRKTVTLARTFYKWNDSGDLCTSPPQKISAWRKSAYGTISTGTHTYSIGCTNGPTTFYGDFYKLTDKSGEGKTDFLESVLIGKFKDNGVTYKGRLIIEAYVTIGTE